MQTYTYDINNIDVEKLRREIKGSILSPKFESMSYCSGEVSIELNHDLTAEEKIALDTIISSHSISMSYREVIHSRIKLAIELGIDMMAEFGAENKEMVANGDMLSSDLFTIASSLSSVQMLVGSGSLEMARAAFADISPMVGLTEERKQKYLDKIDQNLQIIQNRYPL